MEYVKKILGVKYEIKNYENKAKYKYEAKDKSCEKIRRYLIVGLEKYII